MKVLVSFLLAFFPCLIFSANVSGNIFLDNSIDHSGVSIEFTAVSPSAVTGSTLSNSDGSYSLNLADGVYDLKITKSKYDSISKTALFINSDSTLGSDSLHFIGHLVYISGQISDTLYADTSYVVNGNLTVLEGDILFIEPGTEIQFETGTQIQVYGELITKGTWTNKIKFRVVNGSSSMWSGIFYYNEDSIDIKHCIFKDLRWGLQFRKSKNVLIDSCDFIAVNNGIIFNYTYGIVTNTNFDCRKFGSNSIGIENGRLIQNCRISDFSIGVKGTPFTTIQYSIIGNAEVGIIQGVENLNYNVIYNCSGAGLNAGGKSVSNNTFFNNNTAVLIKGGTSDAIFTMNCLADNTKGLDFDGSSLAEYSYNLFWDNGSDVQGNVPTGINVDFTTNGNGHTVDAYFNVFNEPPIFYSEDENHHFFLYPFESSALVDAGDPNKKDPDGSIKDIGAYYLVAWLGQEEHSEKSNEESIQVYPNPVTNDMQITFESHINRESLVFSLVDINGKVVYNHSVSDIQIGKNFHTVDVSHIENGMYFLQSEDLQLVTKIVVNH